MLSSIRRHSVGGFVGMVAVAVATGVVLGSDTWTWSDFKAETPVDHGVMVRGPFDDTHRKMRLAGPVAVTASDHDAGPCFTVYAVTARDDEPQRAARVGGGGTLLRLGPPAFLLVPARRLREGQKATETPRGAYEMRPVLDPPADIDGGPETAGRPAYLGLPVDYRHHFERLPVEAADRGLLVFAPCDLPREAAPVAVADDFGIAKLAARGTSRLAAWLPVQTLPDVGQR
jgi:hypothetical protein